MRPRQRRFVEEYLVDLNGAQAARRAGYGTKRPDKAAYRLLRRPDVAAAVAAGQRKKSEELEISAERVLAEYAKIAFANMSDFAAFGPEGLVLKDMADLAPEQTAAVAEVTESKTQHGGTVRFKLHDKLSALHALARHIGLSAPDKLAFTDTTGGDMPPAPDPYEIARQIAFALRQGEAERARLSEPETASAAD